MEFTSFGRTWDCRQEAVIEGTKRADAAHAEKLIDVDDDNEAFYRRQYEAEYPAMLGRFICDEGQKMRRATAEEER